MKPELFHDPYIKPIEPIDKDPLLSMEHVQVCMGSCTYIHVRMHVFNVCLYVQFRALCGTRGLHSSLKPASQSFVRPHP